MLSDDIVIEAERLLKDTHLILDFQGSGVVMKFKVELVPDSEREIS